MEIAAITNDNFEEEVLACKTPVILDFWADWCVPCQMQAPIFSTFAEEMGDKIKAGKVNVDEEAALALKYQIMSIPTLILMDRGVFIKRVSGLQQAEALREFAESYIRRPEA